MTDLLRAAAEAALASDHSRGATEMIDDRLRIERLVRANARRAMVIDIIERLVEDPEREDFGPSDMEYWSPLHDALREKLRAALAEQEPCDMGDMCIGCTPRRPDGGCPGEQKDVKRTRHSDRDEFASIPGTNVRVRIRTAPPRREWVGLTDEEIADAIRPCCSGWKTLEMLLKLSMDEYRAVEAALKEKNA